MPSLSPIRVAPGGHYFETTDREPFLFIGQNDAISWVGLAGLFRRKDPEAVDAYLSGLAASGVTVLRCMLEYCQGDHRFFERPAGTFNPAMVRLWDDLFERCERFGLRVLLAPWDNFWMSRQWHKHPYNRRNGGPAHSSYAFFTDEAVIQAAERRLRFVAERWGGCGAFAAWDLFNEIHPYWGGTPAQQAAALTRLSDAIRETELATWGFTRPQTVSIFGPDPGPDYSDLIFRHPSLDFATTHIYQGAIDHPRNTVAPAQVMGHWTRWAREKTPADRPFLDTEHGPIHLFNDHRKMLPEAMDDEYERHLMWAHLASGGAGSGLRWPARNPHVLTRGMKRALWSLRQFADLVDWRHFTPRAAEEDVEVQARGVLTFACRDERQAVIWLLRGNPKRNSPGLLPERESLCGVPVRIRGLEPGYYCAEPWDTLRGCALGCLRGRVGDDRTLQIRIPRLEKDLALSIHPCRDPGSVLSSSQS